ncbi:MAG: C4-dicarboxylate ABC transporter [Rhodobacterales bacterium]|nr:MAG: C4-dicarboxylate ABC transporter [Rhodobacterales bacterium]
MSEAVGNRLEQFPVTFFAIVMGLMGVVLALHAATPFYPVAEAGALVVFWLALAVFAVIAVFYLAKLARYPGAVLAEWRHPVKLAFFPTMTISLLLMATALRPVNAQWAEWIWLVGMVGQGVLTLAVVTGWISHRSFEVGHLTPAWFIPAVGNVIVPVAGAQMGYLEISWLFFSGGMMFWGILLTMVMNRLVFHDPMPGRLFPTLVILVAPPSVAFLAYINMVGYVDGFARVLLNAAYIFAALVAFQLPKILKFPFALSFWALSFPMAALSVASFRFAWIEGSRLHGYIGTAVLCVLLVAVAGLIWRTLVAILRGEICQPE